MELRKSACRHQRVSKAHSKYARMDDSDNAVPMTLRSDGVGNEFLLVNESGMVMSSTNCWTDSAAIRLDQGTTRIAVVMPAPKQFPDPEWSQAACNGPFPP